MPETTPSPEPTESTPRWPALLSDDERHLLDEERRLLGDLRTALARHGAGEAADATLAAAIGRLERLFLVVATGEFNSGKSAVLNALLGSRALAEGVTPTTDRITLVQHPDNSAAGAPEAPRLARETVDSEVLRHLDLVDTPGTNAVLREHEVLTREFIPQADLVLFVTSVDRPFSESERAFLEAIRDWGKRIVLVVNKMDLVLAEEDVVRIQDFVEEQSRALLGFAPPQFAVSARRELAEDRDEAGTGGDSGFPALERFLVSTLDEGERLRLKLSSPLRVGRRLARERLAAADEREHLLADDFQALSDIEEQLTLYREDMGRQYSFRRTDVDHALGEFERRGLEFFEETVRLGRLFDLSNKEKIKGRFEREVVADLPAAIERKVADLVEWLVDRDRSQWEAVREHVARRRTEHADRVVGREARSFDGERQRLLESIGRTAQRTVETYDREKEADRLAGSVQRAVAETALLEVGAVGLGATVAALASTTVADVTGLLGAGVLFALGLFVLPARKRKAQRELQEAVSALRQRLLPALDEQFGREMDRSVESIREAIQPYTRFVRGQHDQLEQLRRDIGGLDERLAQLGERIEALG